MLIALDYDDTYTRDPVFWDQMLANARARGHLVICATLRHERDSADIKEALLGKVDDFVFTGGKAKHYFVNEAGYYPSVWIDDMPLFITQDAYTGELK